MVSAYNSIALPPWREKNAFCSRAPDYGRFFREANPLQRMQLHPPEDGDRKGNKDQRGAATGIVENTVSYHLATVLGRKLSAARCLEKRRFHAQARWPNMINKGLKRGGRQLVLSPAGPVKSSRHN